MTTSQNNLSMPLKVIVVGAGIGGLTAAIALRREGHIVEVRLSSHARFALADQYLLI